MKAKGPKFETCLFGPSSRLVPIKAYSNSLIEKINNNLQDEVPKDDVEEKTDITQDETTIENTDLDTAVIKNDDCTPPQTPKREKEPPSRPVKTVSSKKRTVQQDDTVELDITTVPEEDYSHTINLQELRRLSSQGVPNDCSLRPIAWRVLLGYLPLDLSKWQAVLDRDRALYYNLVQDLFVPSDDHPFEEEGRKLRGRGLEVEGKSLRGSPIASPTKGGIKSIKGALEAMGNLLDIVQDEEEIEEMAENVFEIPENVREQWKKSGRDPESLIAGMGGKRSKSSILSRHFNALLVTNNDTASTQTNDEKLAAKAEEALSLGGEIEGTFDPIWRHFLENATLLDEIRKDVVRTHPDLNFFLESNDHIGLRRYAAIERILFVWAKLNKGVSSL